MQRSIIEKYREKRRLYIIRGKLHDLSDDRSNRMGLRLIIGTNRSGTSWLTGILSATSTPLCYIKEPLSAINPPLKYSRKYDSTALPYVEPPKDNSLVKLYDLLSESACRRDDLFGKETANKVIRNDFAAKYCLIKEVHALLQTENIVNALKVPVILISRNPLYVVDSNLYNQGNRAPIYLNEFKYIQYDDFLDKYFSSKKKTILKNCSRIKYLGKRSRIVQSKILTVAVIGKMFEVIASGYDNARYIRYENLCENTDGIFREAAGFFGFEFSAGMSKLLAASQTEIEEVYNPYSIYRDTSAQTNKPFLILYDEEIKVAGAMLDECGLSD